MASEPSPASAVGDLVPFVHVTGVPRSVDFYRLLGLEPRETYEDEGRVVWASMAHASAALMLAEGEAPIDLLSRACCSISTRSTSSGCGITWSPAG
jgi:hypothetical protein